MFTGKIYSTWMGNIQERKITEILRDVEPVGPVLDVGCGPAFLGRFVNDLVLLDIDLESLKKTDAGGFKVLADGYHLPFRDKSFNTVFCIDTIHLLPEKIAGEIERVLSEGMAVISTFCNKYDKSEKLFELKERFKNFKVEKEFFVGREEMDAVIVISKK